MYSINGGQRNNFILVFEPIRHTSLVGTNKIQKKCYFRMRLVGLISIETKNNLLAAIYEYSPVSKQGEGCFRWTSIPIGLHRD